MIVTCQSCDKEFDKFPSQVKISAHHFCSRRCYGEWLSKSEIPRWPTDRGKLVYQDGQAPICSIHDKETIWQKNHSRGASGQWTCRSCQNDRSNRMRQRKRGTLHFQLRLLLYSASSYSRKIGREVTVTPDDLFALWSKQEGCCAITGTLMTYQPGNGSDCGRQVNRTNVSIDRIDSTRGYTLDNIWLVCEWVNRAKQDLTKEELILFANGILANSRICS